MTRFNEETFKVSHPNQEMFVGVFQHGLKAGHFNKSLAQKLTSNMDEVITIVDSISKGRKATWKKGLETPR